MARIAYVLTQDRGGPVDVTTRLAHTIIGAGDHEVRVFAPRPARDAGLLGEHHETVVFGRKGDLGSARELRARIRAWHPDIVHAQDRRAGLALMGLDSARRHVRGILHTYHGVPDDVSEQWFRSAAGGSAPSRYTRAVLTGDAVVARGVDLTVAPSETMARFLRSRLKVPRHKLIHIDNGVALPVAAPGSGPVRKLIFVGLLVPRKALGDLLAALATPGVMPADATLTVAGDGPQRAELEARAAAGPLAGRVEFLGFREDVADLLTAHDALVLPSHMEQQPLVIAEAMGAGKPVVATDTGGVAEMLAVPGTSPYLATPGSVPELAEQLRRLFADGRPGELGQAYAHYARGRFDREVVARKHLGLYAELIDRRGRAQRADCRTG